MTPNSIVDASKKRGYPTGVTGVGLVLALLVIGYGIARPPELSSQATSAAAVAAMPARISNAAANTGAIARTSAADAFRGMSADGPAAGIDAARECAPNVNISEACIFN
jgi:hypothetical protein